MRQMFKKNIEINIIDEIKRIATTFCIPKRNLSSRSLSVPAESIAVRFIAMETVRRGDWIVSPIQLDCNRPQRRPIHLSMAFLCDHFVVATILIALGIKRTCYELKLRK